MWAQRPAKAVVLAATLLACRGPAVGREAKGREQPARQRDILGSAKPLFSHNKEELVIRDFFQDRRNGFFVDVGCGHPIQDSNTYYLETHLGWSGIGVDALPEMARKWKRLRPASRFFNYVVTDHAGAAASFFRAERRVRDISSLFKPEHDPAGGKVESEEIRVPAITLNELLERNGVSRFDLLSMDIEGAEPLALAGLDVERFRPELACVEAKLDNRQPILRYFTAHGYRRIERYLAADPENFYFTPVAARRP